MKRKKKISEHDLDTAFSKFIRLRDRVCQYPLRGPDDYHAGNLQASHFYGRSARSVRFDPENVDALCGRHHQFLEGRKNAEYADFKRKQLGTARFNALKKRYYKLRERPPTEEEKRAMLDRWLSTSPSTR